MPSIYYSFRQNKLTLKDYYILSLLIIFLTLGGYQLYFYPQKYHKYNDSFIHVPETSIDKYIPKISWTIYIYNFVYYLGFGAILIFIKSYKEFAEFVFYALLLMASLVTFFMIYPSILPSNTRNKHDGNTFVKLTQSCDSLMNAFPSAHVAVAVFIAFVLKRYIGNYAFIFPLLIFTTCLTTKQHFVIDCIGGALWGYIFSHITLK